MSRHNEKPKRRKLSDLKIDAIAFVDRGANRRDFAIYKRADISKPFPNEHSARLKNPNDFDPDTFRRTDGGTIYGSKEVPETIAIIWGKIKGSDNITPQSLRFSSENWTVAEARQWLDDNDINSEEIEPAKETKVMGKPNKDESLFLEKEEGSAIDQIKAILEKSSSADFKKEEVEALIESLKALAGIEKSAVQFEKLNDKIKKDAAVVQAVIDLLSNSPTPDQVAHAADMLKAMLQGMAAPAEAEAPLANGGDLLAKAVKLLYSFEKEDKAVLEKAGRKISTSNESKIRDVIKGLMEIIGIESMEISRAADDLKADVKKQILDDKDNKLTEEEAEIAAGLFVQQSLA